jgi:hypothetical protein
VTLKPPNVRRHRWSLVILFVALGAVSLPSQGKSRGVVRLAWDASPEPGVVGYVIYVGTTSGKYTETYKVRKGRTFTYTKAIEGRRYFFAIAAYSDMGVLSALSSEVSAVAVRPKPRRPRPRPANPASNGSARSPSNPSDR